MSPSSSSPGPGRDVPPQARDPNMRIPSLPQAPTGPLAVLARTLTVASGLGSLASAAVQGDAAPLFVEEGAARLPGVVTTCGTPNKDFILEVNGGGLALGDFDGDGDADLVVVDGSDLGRVGDGSAGLPPRLFLNDGAGTFSLAEGAWSMPGGRWGMGAITGDLNGDGHLDLVVTEWGADRVFLNQGGQGLEEITERAGLAGKRWGTSAALFDANGDGVLDLYVTNYLAFRPEEVPGPGGGCRWKGHPVMCGPEGLTPVHDQFYLGQGDGSFTDATVAAGMRPEEAGFGLGCMPLDFDLDGDTDLYVTNDSTPNFLWENRGDGTFREVGFRRGVAYDAGGKEQAGMGIGCADVDGDGRNDLLVTNFSGENNALYRSSGKTGFREASSRLGIGGPSIQRLGWGTGLCDLDLDGDIDAWVLNGHVYPQAAQPGTDTDYAQGDQAFLQGENGRFEERLLSDGGATVSRAGVTGDIDGDGDLDLVAIELDGAVRVLRNLARERAEAGSLHHLVVRLRGRGPNTRGIGARVVAQCGERRTSREIQTSAGFQAARVAEAHFGLGNLESVERLEVHWPSGEVQVLEGVAADQVLVVEEPELPGEGR